MGPNTAILIADDHVLLAESIALALAAPPREIRASITNSLQQTRAALAAGKNFDLVMLDLKMPGMLGLKSVNEIIAAAAPTPVVLFSGNADRALVRSAVDNGARGLIPKTLPLKALVSVIELVLSGQVFVPAEDFGYEKVAERPGSTVLSEREAGIVRLAAEGRTNKEIASAIGTTETNVKMHMRTICRKLNARNRAHAVTISRESSLI